MAEIKLAPLCAAIAVATSGVFLVAGPAFAADRPVIVEAPQADDVPTRLVHYGDLQLATATGEKLLVRRVRKAVREVCDGSNPGADRFDLMDCRSFAWSGARPQMARAINIAKGVELADASGARSIVIRLSK